MEEIWQKLFDSKQYTKSFVDFQNDYSSIENQDWLYGKVSESKMYTGSLDQFKSDYFSNNYQNIAETIKVENMASRSPEQVKYDQAVAFSPEDIQALDTEISEISFEPFTEIKTVGYSGNYVPIQGEVTIEPHKNELKQAREELDRSGKDYTDEDVYSLATNIIRSEKEFNIKKQKNEAYLENLSPEEREAIGLEKNKRVGELANVENGIEFWNVQINQFQNSQDAKNLISFQDKLQDKDFVWDTSYAEQNGQEILVLQDGRKVPKAFIDEYQRLSESYNKNSEYFKRQGAKLFTEKEEKDELYGDLNFLKRNYSGLEKAGWIAYSSVGSAGINMGIGLLDIGQIVEPGLANELQTKKDDLSAVLKEVDRITEEDYKYTASYDEAFDSVGNFGEWMAVTAAGQTGTFAMLATGNIGLVGIGASTYGSTISNIEQLDKENGTETSNLEKRATALGYSVAEVGLSALPTVAILGKAAKAFAAGSKRELQGGIKKYILNNYKDIGNNFATEYVTEGATQVIQNGIDVIRGAKSAASLFDGVAEASMTGGMLGATLGAVPMMKGIAMSAFSDSNTYSEYRKIAVEISELNNLANNLVKGSPDHAKMIALVDAKTKEASDILNKVENNIENNLTKEGYALFSNVTQQQEVLRDQADAIYNSKTIPNTQKEAALDGLKKEFDALAAQRDIYKSDFKNIFAIETKDVQKKYTELANSELINAGEPKPKGEAVKKKANELYRLDKLTQNNKKAANAVRALSNAKVSNSYSYYKDNNSLIEEYSAKMDELIALEPDRFTEKDKQDGIKAIKEGQVNGLNLNYKGKDGKTNYAIFVSQENAMANGKTETAIHEIGHSLFIEGLGANPELYTELASEIMAYLKENNASAYNRILIQTNNQAADEILTNFLEEVSSGRLDLEAKQNKSFTASLGLSLRGLFNKTTNSIDPITFEGISDVASFVEALGKKISNGTFTAEDVKFIQEKKSLTSRRPTPKKSGDTKEKSSGTKASETKQKISVAAAKAKLKLDAIGSNPKGYDFNDPDILKELDGQYGMISAQVQPYINKGLELDRQELIQETIFQILKRKDLNKFNSEDYLKKNKGVKNDSLYGFLNGRIRLAILDAFKANPSIVSDYSKSQLDVLETEFSSETAEDAVNTSVRAETEAANEVEPADSSSPLKDVIDTSTNIDGSSYESQIKDQLIKETALNIKKFGEEISANRTVTPFIYNVKEGLSQDFYKTTKKLINSHPGGYAGFLVQTKDAILDNYTTTYLAKHPLFRKGVLKSVGGKMGVDNLGKPIFIPNWVAPTKIGPGTYGWVDANGVKLNVDRDNAGGKGLTSGPEFIKRNPKINNVISTDEFVDYHFKDGANRKSKKQNPEDALAKQLSSEIGFEFLKEDLDNNGPLSEQIKLRADLYGVLLGDVEIANITKDIERGGIKFNFTARVNPAVAELIKDGTRIAVNFGGLGSEKYNVWYNKLNEQEQNVVDTFWANRGIGYLEYLQDQEVKRSNKGVTYESYLLELFKELDVDPSQFTLVTSEAKGSDSTGAGDITIKIGKETINIEVKLNNLAQMGSFSAVDGLPPELEGSAAANDFKEAWDLHLKARDEYSNKAKALHEQWMQEGFLGKTKYRNLYRGAPIDGSKGAINFDSWPLKIPTQLATELRKIGQQKELSFTVNLPDLQPIIDHYNNKGVYYMQIGKFGFVALGQDISGLDAPLIVGKGVLQHRMAAGKPTSKLKLRTIRTRDFYKMTKAVANELEGQTLYNLDLPGDFKKQFKELAVSTGSKQSFTKTDMQNTISDMIASKFGIKEMSAAKAFNLGKNKGRFKFFIPYNAEDFMGLLYPLLGKGKLGDAGMEFINNTLIKPFNRAENSISSYKQRLATDFKVLQKKLDKVNKTVDKQTIKEIEAEGYTAGQAARVYIWNKLGYEIPGISVKEKSRLVALVNQSPALLEYANGLINITKTANNYPKPSEDWYGDNVLSELYNHINVDVREKYLSEWSENVDAIFTKDTFIKLEAALGPVYVTNLKQTLARMKTGRNRPLNLGTAESAALDYINAATGVVMFFNSRSAVLQTISSVNFINWSDNNLFAAGKTLANPKDFGSTFMEIMNSDFLKQRRSGLEINVEEAEIAQAAAQTKNKAKAFMAAFLKAGYTPTQFADSFAIAIGGTPFLINRTKTYIKDGVNPEEARKLAFEDFRALAEEHQQSSRQDKISNIQTGLLGRLVFAFNNTPFQMSRLQKKTALDLINRRGDPKTNLSKLVYYGTVQNLVFYSLQQALFKTLFSTDEEEPETVKQRDLRLANSMLDGFLRGSGMPGAIISTVKNVIIKYLKEEEKGYNADYGNVLVEASTISPPISAKARNIYSGLKTRKYFLKTKKGLAELETRQGFIDNPVNQANAKIFEGITNLPTARLMRKADNLAAVSDQSIEGWRRLALLAGWSKWDLGITNQQKAGPKKSRSEVMKDVYKEKRRLKWQKDSIIAAKAFLKSQERK